MLKKHRHNPAHLYLDDHAYFITAAIYHKRPLLAEPALKDKLLELLQGYFAKHEWELHHWVILDNHYHLLGKSRLGKDLVRQFQAYPDYQTLVLHEAKEDDF
jgi:putative transposase